jgi:methyl-accepting chemotaxis protein
MLRNTRLSVRIVVPVVVLFAVCAVAMVTYVWRSATQQTVDASVVSARATVSQFKTLRAYYTEQVVNKVKAAGAMKIAASHSGADTIPLPATMIHELSELLSKDASATQIHLYSKYPFPNRASRKLDGFAEDALAQFEKDPESVFMRTEDVNGVRAVRVAMADRMAVDACVSCHNSHPDSPKKDWKLEDVRGALEVVVPIDHQLAATSSMLAGIGVATVLALIAAALGMGWFARRSIEGPIRRAVAALMETAGQTSDASRQVAASSQSLSQGSTEQAASLEETSASMEEMASMTRQNAQNSQTAAAMMAETERHVQGVNGALGGMVSSMQAIKDSSDKVSKIIKTIDEIAFQTNILALNAAVEAARAGEAGLGFAVVADEVRALAQRSARAAQDTATLIAEAIDNSNDGQQKVQQVAGVIDAITTSTGKAKALIDEVSSASQQQSQGIGQVSQAVSQMEQVTQNTAARAEESAAASEQLSAQAEASMAVVGRLAAMIGGDRAEIAPAAQKPAIPVKSAGRKAA